MTLSADDLDPATRARLGLPAKTAATQRKRPKDYSTERGAQACRCLGCDPPSTWSSFGRAEAHARREHRSTRIQLVIEQSDPPTGPGARDAR